MFHIGGPQILGTTVLNLVAQVLRTPD